MPDIILTVAVVATSAAGFAFLAIRLSRGKERSHLVLWGSLAFIAWFSLWLEIEKRPGAQPFSSDTAAHCLGVGGTDVDLAVRPHGGSSVMVPSAFLGSTTEVTPTKDGFKVTSGDNHVDVELDRGVARGSGTFYVCEPDDERAAR